MFNLIKYELRRNIYTIGILYVCILLLEAYTLFNLISKNESRSSVAFALMILAGTIGIFYIFIMGIQSYSRELGSKNSYMVFMTPNSTAKIIASKFLATGVVALITTIVSVLLIVLDYNLALHFFPSLSDNIDIMKEFSSILGLDISGFFLYLLLDLIISWISVFSAIGIAYFAITLSATALANKKGRGVISFLLFLLLFYIVTKITGYFPTVSIGSGVIETILSPLFSYLFHIVIIIAAIFGNAYLLDKKVSL